MGLFTKGESGSSFELLTPPQLFFPSGNVVSTSDVKCLICKQAEGKKKYFFSFLDSLHDFISCYVALESR